MHHAMILQRRRTRVINLGDFLPIFKKRRLTLLYKKHEAGDIYSFVFKLEGKAYWKAGQHGALFIEHEKISRSFRPFSLASAPSEDVMISTRITDNPSPFKKALSTMQPGQQASLRGPIGSFYIKDRTPVLFIAGGIGITPFRALIKNSLINPGTAPAHIHLLYSDDRGQFAYEDELQQFATTSDVTIALLTSREELKAQISDYTHQHANKARYYVSGSPGMVKAMQATLKAKGIRAAQIVTDTFLGLH